MLYTCMYDILTKPMFFSILFQGPRIWNSLPNDIKNAPSFSIFKRVIISYIYHSKSVIYLHSCHCFKLLLVMFFVHMYSVCLCWFIFEVIKKKIHQLQFWILIILLSHNKVLYSIWETFVFQTKICVHLKSGQYPVWMTRKLRKRDVNFPGGACPGPPRSLHLGRSFRKSVIIYARSAPRSLEIRNTSTPAGYYYKNGPYLRAAPYYLPATQLVEIPKYGQSNAP